MKVLITTDCYTSMVNGVATSGRNLVKALKSCGAEVRVLTLSPNHHSFVEDDITFISSLNADKIYPNVRVSVASRGKLINELIEWHPDIIHSQSEFSTFMMARYIAKHIQCPIVHTYHTVYEEYSHYIFSHNKHLGKNAAKALTNHIAKRVNGMIAPTEKVSDLLIRYGCHAPVWVMPTGLDLEKIAAPSAEERKAALRHKLGIPEDHRVIVYTGRLAAEKNVEEIVEYMGRKRPQNTTLLIVGDGPARPSIENAIAKNKVDFAVMAGMVDPKDMHLYYSIGDIFVSASQSETQGLTYIEALANGLPLLCRWDKCLENVLIDGKTGYAYNTEQEFSQNLDRLLSSDLAEMSDNAVKLIYNNFSLDSFARKAMSIYKECISHYVAKQPALGLIRIPNLHQIK